MGYFTLCGIACPWMLQDSVYSSHSIYAQRTLADDPVDCNTEWPCLLTTERRQNSLAVWATEAASVLQRHLQGTTQVYTGKLL